MPRLSSWLSDISRRKLRIAASSRDGLRDSINLHRFVLLKNSITQASLTPAEPPSQSLPAVDDRDEKPVLPSASISESYVDCNDSATTPDSESKWFESVLEVLEDDFDTEVEVDVHAVEEDDDCETASDDSYSPWPPSPSPHHYHHHAINSPTSLSHDMFSPPSTAVLLPQPPPLHLSFDSRDSPFSQPFVEPRYPEADFDLPISETSSDSDSDDESDDGPLTPYSGSQRTLEQQRRTEPEVYVEHDSYFLYPSELDPITPPPIYYHQC